jgi:putative cardiolipin synthase
MKTLSRLSAFMRLRWLRALLALSAIAMLGACGSLPPMRERAMVTSAPADPSTALATIAAASTPPGEHSGFRLMPLGVYSLDARIQLAQRAQRSLVVQYYQLENDAVGRLLLRSLREAALRGVKVRVLVDDLYTVKSQQLLLALSETQNVDVRPQRLHLTLRCLAA